MQRFVRPAIFVLILAAVLFVTLMTGRGENLTSPFMMGRFADFAQGSPLLATLFSIVLLPLALFLSLFPEDSAITMTVGNFGFWFGVLVSTYAITAVGGTTCTLTRSLLQGTVRRFMAARRQAGKIFSRRVVLPLEYCLLFEVLLLVCNVPAVFVGFLLGLVGMRTKSFCVAAVPILLARTSIVALGTQEAGLFRIVLLCLFGTALFALSLAWVGMLIQKRVAREREETIRALVKTSEAFREPSPAFEDIDLDDVERSGARSGRANLSLGRILMVLVREGTAQTDSADDASAGPDNRLKAEPRTELVAKLVEEGRNLGLRVLVCSMDESARLDEDGREKTVLGGFAETDVVADLGELFWRGFQEGADTVIAVRAASPLVGAEVLTRAVEAVKKSGLALVPLMGEKKSSFCLVALTSPFGEKHFEQGLLKRRHFCSDIAFALTAYAPHPEVLRPLPHVALCRPLVSVVLIAETASTALVESIRRARTSSCAECVAVLLPEAGELEKEARAMGAIVFRVDDIRDVNKAVADLAGSIVLFAPAGVLLPERFDEAVWQCMEKEHCVLGNFGLPDQVPGLQRALRWFGSSVKPGRGSGPVLLQGIFLGRDDFVRFGGFESQDIEEAVSALVQRAHMEGDVVSHNRRVSLARDGALNGVLDGARGLGKFGFARLFRKGLGADDLAVSAREAVDKAREMVEECDHCGRCTHVSPMLHKHNVDLADLPKKPLLAWHCFLCGACTAACHKGIDAVNLVRTLRKAYVARHGNRVSRPGHCKTVILQKMVGVFAKTALPGKNLLLDADFCCAWPRTALALARKMRSWNIGVVIAEPGARAMDIGLESGARKKARALRAVMDRKGITGFYTVSPSTHACLVGMGLACEPVYAVLREMGQGHVDLAGRHLLEAVNDRAHEAFANALNPLLDGERRLVDVPCCGAGGEAAVVEPKLSRDLKNAVKSVLKPKERVLTISTQCAESLSHAGIPCDHALTALMGLTEGAASGLGQISALVKTLVAVSSLSPDKDGKSDQADQGDRTEGGAAFVKGLFGKLMNINGTSDRGVPAPPLDIQMPDDGLHGQEVWQEGGMAPDAEQGVDMAAERNDGLDIDLGSGLEEGESGADEGGHADSAQLTSASGEVSVFGSGDAGDVRDSVDEGDAEDAREAWDHDESDVESNVEPGVGAGSASSDFQVTPSEDAFAPDVFAQDVPAEGHESFATHGEAEDRKEDLAEHRDADVSANPEALLSGESLSVESLSGDSHEGPGQDEFKAELEVDVEVDLEDMLQESLPENIDGELEGNSTDIKELSHEEKTVTTEEVHGEFSPPSENVDGKDAAGESVVMPVAESIAESTCEPMVEAKPEARLRPVVSDVTEKGVIEIYEAEEQEDSEAVETDAHDMDAEDSQTLEMDAESGAAQGDTKPAVAKPDVRPVASPVVHMVRAVSLKSFSSANGLGSQDDGTDDNENRR